MRTATVHSNGGARGLFPRFDCEGVSVVYALPDTNEEPCEGLLMNISKNGAAIVAPRRLLATTPVCLRIRGGAGTLQLNCKCRVLHCRRETAHSWIVVCEFRQRLTMEQVEQTRLLEGTAMHTVYFVGEVDPFCLAEGA